MSRRACTSDWMPTIRGAVKLFVLPFGPGISYVRSLTKTGQMLIECIAIYDGTWAEDPRAALDFTFQNKSGWHLLASDGV